MKRVLTILLLVSFVMALAPPCHAAGYGEIAISLVDVPAELQERSVLITLGNGPNDTDAVLVMLNGLNQYSQTVTLLEGTYYCNASIRQKKTLSTQAAAGKADSEMRVFFCADERKMLRLSLIHISEPTRRS